MVAIELKQCRNCNTINRITLEEGQKPTGDYQSTYFIGSRL
jgi:hypothetical protein